MRAKWSAPIRKYWKISEQMMVKYAGLPSGWMFDSVGDSFLVNAAAEITQFGLFILLGIVVFPIFFKGINPAFGLMLPAGFVGGAWNGSSYRQCFGRQWLG